MASQSLRLILTAMAVTSARQDFRKARLCMDVVIAIMIFVMIVFFKEEKQSLFVVAVVVVVGVLVVACGDLFVLCEKKNTKICILLN